MPDAIETYYDAMGDLYVVTANEGAVPMVVECTPEVCPNGPGEFEETELGEEFFVEGEDSVRILWQKQYVKNNLKNYSGVFADMLWA